IVDLHHIGVSELHGDARLVREQLAKVGIARESGQNALEHDAAARPLGARTLRQKQLRHASRANRREQRVPRKHASVIIAALLLGSAVAHAARRVVVITAAPTPADLEVTRAELEGGQLETRVLAAAELPLSGELRALDAARREAEATLEKARGAFVRTNYAEGRAIAGGFDPTGLAWGGDARVARVLAQLALVAAQGGDRQGFDRAVARYPRLELDPARWSPDVRAGYERALAARENGPHGTLFVGSEPAGAAVLVDGESVGRTPLRMRIVAGEHAILILQDASAPIHRAVEVQPDGPPRRPAPLAPRADEERWGALRLAGEAGEDPGARARADAARRLDADAVAVVRPAAGGGVRGVAGGSGVGWAAFEQR